MRISTKGRYALRLMLDLAMNSAGGFIPLKAVAQRQEISDKYLEQIIHRLSRAGLVASARGAQGGYRLARRAEDYSVGEILRTVEGSLAPVACLECGAEPCSKAPECRTLPMWTELDRRISGYLDSVTIADLMKK